MLPMEMRRVMTAPLVWAAAAAAGFPATRLAGVAWLMLAAVVEARPELAATTRREHVVAPVALAGVDVRRKMESEMPSAAVATQKIHMEDRMTAADTPSETAASVEDL